MDVAAEKGNRLNLPAYVPPFGLSLRRMLEHEKMPQADLAARLSVTEKFISELINGENSLTPKIAAKLGDVFGVDPVILMNRENIYQQFKMRQAEKKEIEKEYQTAKQYPLKELVKRGVLPASDDAYVVVKSMRTFFSVSALQNITNVSARHNYAFRKFEKNETLSPALLTWLRLGELDAKKMMNDNPLPEYDEKLFEMNLRKIRALTSKNDIHAALSELQKLCFDAGVVFSIIKEIPGMKTYAATRWYNRSTPQIILSLMYKSNDHFWFSFFHEAGHILLHKRNLIFVENDQIECQPDTEKEANEFAAEFLILSSDFRKYFGRYTRPSKVQTIEFARKTGVHPGIVVGRLQHEGIIPFTHLNGLKQKLIWKR